MAKYKLYTFAQNPNGTSDLLIVDSNDQVIDSIPEAVFGDLESARFGWGGDAMGNINACFYGESIGMIEYSDEDLESIEAGEISDVQQVVEVTLDTVLENIAVSPVSDGSQTIKQLSRYFEIQQEESA